MSQNIVTKFMDYNKLFCLFSVVHESKLNANSGKSDVSKRGMILPFEPLIMTFHNVNYFVDMPKVLF